MRSVLFTPGTKPERIEKALQGPADVVVADLEDSVAPSDKIEARIAVRNVLMAHRNTPAVRAVRINAWPSGLAEEDLSVLMAARPDLIVVPKAESVDAIRALDARLQEVADERTRLMLILETAKGVLHAEELAAASDRVVAVAFGAEDLAADVGMTRTPSNVEVAVARGLVALGAAAADVAALDMITADYKDVERTRREAEEAKGLGYRGKMCLHPAQVDAVHAAFRPDEAAIAWARKVVAAAKGGAASEGGVVVVDGRMIDVPLVQQAKQTLADAEEASARDA